MFCELMSDVLGLECRSGPCEALQPCKNTLRCWLRTLIWRGVDFDVRLNDCEMLTGIHHIRLPLTCWRGQLSSLPFVSTFKSLLFDVMTFVLEAYIFAKCLTFAFQS